MCSYLGSSLKESRALALAGVVSETLLATTGVVGTIGFVSYSGGTSFDFADFIFSKDFLLRLGVAKCPEVVLRLGSYSTQPFWR
jgi:hypothetical protein